MRFFRSRNRCDWSDEEIAARYRATGDINLVGILFDRHAPLVFGICLGLLRDEEESKDTVLDLFEKLISDLRKYEIRRFAPWLHAAARNRCYAGLNRARNRADGFAPDDLPAPENDPESEQASASRLVRLGGALAAIREEQKDCIELFYLHRLSYDEIARRTGMTFNQVKSHIQNGKRNLKILLSRKP